MSARGEKPDRGGPSGTAAGTVRGFAADSERRRAEAERRRAGRVAATFAVSEADGPHLHLCQAEDIAVGGITIKHARGLSHQPRTEVALRFSLPGSGEQIEARGEIVSDARAGRFRRTGVRFTAVEPEHQRLIAAYCRRG